MREQILAVGAVTEKVTILLSPLMWPQRESTFALGRPDV